MCAAAKVQPTAVALPTNVTLCLPVSIYVVSVVVFRTSTAATTVSNVSIMQIRQSNVAATKKGFAYPPPPPPPQSHANVGDGVCVQCVQKAIAFKWCCVAATRTTRTYVWFVA